MFNTWKQSTCSKSYTVLPTEPPFNRPRSGKPLRSACNPCRARKIRCTSEPTGCLNCQRRSLDCRYATDGDSKAIIGAVKGRKQLGQKAASGNAVSTCTNDESISEDDFRSTRPSDVDEREVLTDNLDTPVVEFGGMESDWSEWEAASGSPGTSVVGPWHNLSMNPVLGLFDLENSHKLSESGEAFQVPSPLECSTAVSGSNFRPSDSSPFPDFLSAYDTIIPTETGTAADTAQDILAFIESSSPSSCLCPTTPLDTWENLVTNISSKNATNGNLVQSQDAAMSSCEILVRCHWCSSQSQDVTLLIDICAKLLESLERQGKEYLSASEMPGGNDDGDDEDRHDVRRSMWMARMQRLGQLIASVGTLLNGKQWSAHLCLLQGVQLRFTSVMFGWEH